jgi:hypothetical protein
MSKEIIIQDNLIKNKIYVIRGKYVLLDYDLAELYEVETKSLNQAVKRNQKRFPKNYIFQLNKTEFDFLRSQIVTAKTKMSKKRFMPYAFTEYGVAMLSSVLKSDKAIEISIKIIDAFIFMKKFLFKNKEVFFRIDNIERKQIEYQIKTDEKFDKIFNLLQTNIPKQGIFFDGQVFDAYKFACDLIKSAKKNIILIDNYIDETVLEIFTKTKVNVKIYSANCLSLDIDKYLKQYNNIEIINFKKSHDRFLIIDEQVYHIGASLKDLGKKWFAFSRLNKDGLKILGKIQILI